MFVDNNKTSGKFFGNRDEATHKVIKNSY